MGRRGALRGPPPLYPRPSGQPRAHPPAVNLRTARGSNERNAPHHGPRQTRRPRWTITEEKDTAPGWPAGAARSFWTRAASRLATGAAAGALRFSASEPALHGVQRCGSRQARQLEGGRKLYRPHSQLSITQRVRSPTPHAGPLGVEGTVIDAAPGSEPFPGQCRQLAGSSLPLHDGISRWTP
jgi:hypothetical protein